eukprot:GEMP01007339.1.p1 GENE.GEMP01007339.1~~GEMP01007339.1.p1  ORF type:complete len:794 (+),score=187.78 GEMP01007339.1:511-2892(+)
MMHLHQDSYMLHRYATPNKNIAVSAQNAPHQPWATFNHYPQLHAASTQAPPSHAAYYNSGAPHCDFAGRVNFPQLDHYDFGPPRGVHDMHRAQYPAPRDVSDMLGPYEQPLPYPHVLSGVQHHHPHGMSEYAKHVLFATDNDVRGSRAVETPPVTALMVHNIPYNYDANEFCEHLEHSGFAPHAHIDFVYLPIDAKTKSNLGYYKKNPLEAADSNVQGLEENWERYAKSRSIQKICDPPRQPFFWCNSSQYPHKLKEEVPTPNPCLGDVTSRSSTVATNSTTTTNASSAPSSPMECIPPLSSAMDFPAVASSPIGYTSPLPPLDYIITPSLHMDCSIPVTSSMQPSSVNYAASTASGAKAAQYFVPHLRHAGYGPTTPCVAAAIQQQHERHSPLCAVDAPRCANGDIVEENRENVLSGPIAIVGEPTTLMIRHIPYRYSQRDLIEDVRDMGIELGLHMDFFYLPIDPKTGSNLGYAFLNMTDKNALNKVWSLTGQRLPRFLKDTRKVLSVDVCSIQGYDNNWRHYEGSSTMNRLSPGRRPIFSQISSTRRSEDTEEDEACGKFLIDTFTNAHHPSNWRPTTFMLQNIRNFYTQKELLDDLQNMCQLMPTKDMDYLYLPMNTQRSGNLGYAFINFTNVQAQQRFMNLESPSVPPFFQSKVTRVLDSVTIATTQGSFHNYKNWCKSSDKSCKPGDKPTKEKHARPLFWGLSVDQLESEVHSVKRDIIPPPPGLEIGLRDAGIRGPPGLEPPPGLAASASVTNSAPSMSHRWSDKMPSSTTSQQVQKPSMAAPCGA